MSKKFVLYMFAVFMFFVSVESTHAAMETKFRICSVKGTVQTGRVFKIGEGPNERDHCPLKRTLDKTECRVVRGRTMVETGPDSFAIIEFPHHYGNGKVKLQPNTKIIVEFNKIYIFSGTSWFKVEVLRRGLVIRTPTAILGIRGTEFLVDVANDGTTNFSLIEGKLEISDSNGQNPFTLTAGKQVEIPVNSSPLQPKPLQIAENQKWWTNWPTLVPISEMPSDDPGSSTTTGLVCDITSPSGFAFLNAGETLNFAGTAQSPSGGDIVYSWTFGERGAVPATSTKQNPGKVVFKWGGNYKATLTVTDSAGETCRSSRHILVHDSNDPRETCEGYAQISIEQSEENRRKKCGYTGEHWHSNEYEHQKWCQSVSLNQAIAGLKKRDERLNRCGSGTDTPGGGTGNIGSGTTVGTNSSEAIADAYVYAYSYRNWNKANLGAYPQLRAGWHPVGGETRTYIKFDLSTIDPTRMNKAVLRLYQFSVAGGTGINLGIYNVTSPWLEGSDIYHSGQIEKTAAPGELSWVQQPAVNRQAIATFNPGNIRQNWIDVDITPLVKKWLAGSPNYGLLIKPEGHLSRSTGESVYHFAARERGVNLDPPKGTNKGPVLLLTDNAIGGKQQTISSVSSNDNPFGSRKSTFSCKNKDNIEKGCCCFKGAHTYRFAPQHVVSVLVQFDTGKRFNCRSAVTLEVDRGNGWETVKIVQANSSRNGSELAPTEVLVPVNGTIRGFRISDGCVCCIDSSKITLNPDSPRGSANKPAITQLITYTGGGNTAVYRWRHNRDKDWISLAEGEISDSQMQSWGYTKKMLQFYGSKTRPSNGVAVYRWWHNRDKDWISLAEGEISDSQMQSWGYTKKMFQFYAWKTINDINILLPLAGNWIIKQSNGFTGKLDLQQDATGRLTGTAVWSNHETGSILGKLSGNEVKFTISYPGGLKGTYTGILTQDSDQIIDGFSHATNGGSANWSAARD